MAGSSTQGELVIQSIVAVLGLVPAEGALKPTLDLSGVVSPPGPQAAQMEGTGRQLESTGVQQGGCNGPQTAQRRAAACNGMPS